MAGEIDPDNEPQTAGDDPESEVIAVWPPKPNPSMAFAEDQGPSSEQVAPGGDPTADSPAPANLSPSAGVGSGGSGSGGSGTRRRQGASTRGDWWRSPWAIGIAALVVALAGTGIALALVSGSSAKSVAASTPKPTATAAAGPTCPLTGQPAPGGAVPKRPALVIKVDNYPGSYSQNAFARPQSGLNQADIVFEEPVEGLYTRFAAVYQCQQAAFVGPVRSARYGDIGIVDELSHPLFFHVGGIDPILSLIAQANDNDQNLFYVDSGIIHHAVTRSAPDSTYISTHDAWGVDPSDTSAPAPIFQYSAAVPSGAVPITSAHVPFSQFSDETWTWDQAAGGWDLSYSGTPAKSYDGLPDSGQPSQITKTNVVIESVTISYGPWLETEGIPGSNEVEPQVTGSGPVTVLRDGEAITGTWTRPSPGVPATLTAANGQPITLAPGQTWVDLLPSTDQVTTAGAGGSAGSG